MEIKVYVSCCGGEKAVKAVNEALKQAGVTAQVSVISDMANIVKAGIMSTPTIVIAGRTVASGQVPKVPDLVKWIAEAGVTTA
jgi:predicted DsbA family dithiol-disulfide isomerase